ncbi:unnamed protein product [Brugia timori]|uniref:Uncharacterized protein n=1 Tax=Brugia timori TaxID=42155 RepID=A0A3P7W7U4_9BILA|nr:unnamed protein product [Brugia timori]
MFISLLLHKGIEAFSVGLQISRTIAQQVKIVIATITIYSLMTPIGSFAGLILQVLFEQRNDSKAIREEIIAIALGVLTISGFQYFEGNFRTMDQQNIINSNSAK